MPLTHRGKALFGGRIYHAVLLFASGILLIFLLIGLMLYAQQRQVKDATRDVTHTYRVIMAGKDVEGAMQRMLLHQRGYVQTLETQFRDRYEQEKQLTLRHLDRLQQLTRDNTHQQPRIEEVKQLFDRLLAFTDHRMAHPEILPTDLPNRTEGTMLSLRIHEVVDDLMQEEGSLLSARARAKSQGERDYTDLMFSGFVASASLIILLNALVLRLYARKARLRQESQKAQERLAQAMKSTSDGIFDWDITTNEVYYSPRLKQMLGYKDDELDNQVGTIRALIHPDDADAVQAEVDACNAGRGDLNTVYRIMHRDGHYLWFHSRAKATFDADGKALRLIGASADITAIKAIEEQSLVEKEMAVAASKAKTDFLTNMSHEIRTPLNAIIGVSTILSRGMVKTEQQREQLVTTLHQSSLSLLDLINDVLDLTKIESGEMDLEYKRFPLSSLMKQVGSIMQVRAEEKGLHFRMDYEALAAATYLGDEARVRQILLNLIGNAIKFTEAGQVALEVVRNDGEIHFRVTDTGIGIPTAHLEKIFNKFEQADNSTTRKYGGSGLGLAISQTLARLMGGRIEVTSEMNQGSVFTLIVPDHTETQASSAPVSVAVPAEISDRPLAGKRVLIAEDFENNLMVMQYFMESLGASFDVARNGREALTLYREQPYDIVLMDVQMPEMDGIKATKEIRAYEVETSRSPAIIIAMTAHALAGDASRCLEAGMDDYLSKPLVEGDIRTKIQHLLAA